MFISDLLWIVADLGETSARKVLQRAVRLRNFNYVCIYTSGIDNAWVDLLSRWIFNPKIRCFITIHAFPSADDPTFIWLCREEIAMCQQITRRYLHFHSKEILWHTKDNKIWNPSADNLELRHCVNGHNLQQCNAEKQAHTAPSSWLSTGTPCKKIAAYSSNHELIAPPPQVGKTIQDGLGHMFLAQHPAN